MLRQIIRYCWPFKKQLGWALTVLGAILLLVFVPYQVWISLVGVIFVAAGIALSKS